MSLWRICKRDFAELDGEGARLYGGRWNPEGLAVVYLSTTASLAALEYLVHVDPTTAPTDLVILRVDAPDDVSSETLDPTRLGKGWDDPAGSLRCLALGEAWIREQRSCLLRVPSAVIGGEWNVLLNPKHPQASAVEWAASPFVFDPRLLGSHG